MKKLVFAVSLLFLTGCGTQYTHPSHFYVKSLDEGYRVCSDHEVGNTVCFSKAYTDPTDAKILTEELNRDMEGNWEKR